MSDDLSVVIPVHNQPAALGRLLRAKGSTTPTVLFVNDLADVGGGQTVMLDVARILIGAGFRAHVASPPGDLADQSLALGAQWHDFPYSQRRLLTPAWRLPRPQAMAARITEGRRLAALATDVGADIVHTGALVPHVDTGAFVSGLRARTVWHLNQVHPSYLFAGPLPDKIISVSDAALRPATWRRGAVSRSSVVRNGIDLDRFRPPSDDERARARNALDLSDEFTVVTVARLEPLKGVDTLIRALAECRVRPTLVVIGDEPGLSGGSGYADALRSLAADLALDVRFLGTRPDVGELLWAADMFAYASRWDAAPLVLAEASASGLAVVTSNAGGCSEIIVDECTGIVLKPDDIAGFATAIDRLADDPEMRHRLGTAGRRRASEVFDGATFGERLLPHYLDLVGLL